MLKSWRVSAFNPLHEKTDLLLRYFLDNNIMKQSNRTRNLKENVRLECCIELF